MITAILHDWMGRVLDQGRLRSPVKDNWKLEAYEQYHAKLDAPKYPCFFGQSSEARGEMLYTFIAGSKLHELASNMRQFVSLISTARHERSSLAAIFVSVPLGLVKNAALIFMVMFVGGMFGVLRKMLVSFLRIAAHTVERQR